MKARRLSFSLVLALLMTNSAPVTAQSLRVGVVGSPPFTIKENGTIDGISAEIWQEIVRAEGLEVELVSRQNVSETIEEVANGQLDAAIGPISITSKRLERVAFTQPYFNAEIGLMLPMEPPSLWSRVRPFFGLAFLGSVGLLVGAIFVVGNVIWLVERKHNGDHFPPTYLPGVGNGMWWALVTLTTVGYGDRTPVTPAGRCIAGVWMVITMVTVSSLTAGIATALTLSLSDIKSEKFIQPDDLEGSRVAVPAGSTSAELADFYQTRAILTENLDSAIQRLQAGQVEAVIFDRPALRYYLHLNPNAPVRVTDFTLASEDYGFVLPHNSPLLPPINATLVELREAGRIEEIKENWLN